MSNYQLKNHIYKRYLYYYQLLRMHHPRVKKLLDDEHLQMESYLHAPMFAIHLGTVLK